MTQNLEQLRREFVSLAMLPEVNVAELCRRFEISRKTAYKWIARFESEGEAGLAEQSRRPKSSPKRISLALEQEVVELRQKHPAWGARKLKRRLEDLGLAMPAASTVTAVLRRQGLIEPEQSCKHRPVQRFERSAPNQLWQMDFKGDVPLSRGGRCHPLPIIDDHSRYLVGIYACANQQDAGVRACLEATFERYGLPEKILCDNGGPWKVVSGEWTRLAVWLLRHGVGLCHGRPYHPQTQGKEERLNRTLKAEVLRRGDLHTLEQAQEEFGKWREIYNRERPHEALGMAVPVSRYRPSQRAYRAQLEPIEYGVEDLVKKVKSKGEITWKSRTYFIGRAFVGEPVALRQTHQEHLVAVYYCHQKLGVIDLREQAPSKNHYLSIRQERL